MRVIKITPSDSSAMYKGSQNHELRIASCYSYLDKLFQLVHHSYDRLGLYRAKTAVLNLLLKSISMFSIALNCLPKLNRTTVSKIVASLYDLTRRFGRIEIISLDCLQTLVEFASIEGVACWWNNLNHLPKLCCCEANEPQGSRLVLTLKMLQVLQ